MQAKSKLKQKHLILLGVLTALIGLSDGMNVIHEKKNILIKENESYIFQVGLQKQNADLIPSYVQIQYDIYNYNGTSCNYFDFFYYVSDSDIDCYNYAIGNESYLFPCPFLSNNYARIRTNNVSGLNQIPKLEINKLQNIDYTFIVDNTKFPFPSGAYPYTDININIKTSLSLHVSSLYEDLAIKLIWINSTVLLIFLFIIGVLIWKEKRIRRQIQGEKKSNMQNQLFSSDNQKQQKVGDSSDSEQQENYAEFLGKTVLAPSLLESKDRSFMVERESL